jgi:hypothetical protein
MRWRPFYLAQLKLALAQPFALAFVVLALTFSLALGLIAQNKTDRQLTVAFVLEDSNQLANRLVALTARQETLDVVVMSRQAAFRALNQDKLEAVFVVTERFSEQIAQGAYRRWSSATPHRPPATLPWSANRSSPAPCYSGRRAGCCSRPNEP